MLAHTPLMIFPVETSVLPSKLSLATRNLSCVSILVQQRQPSLHDSSLSSVLKLPFGSLGGLSLNEFIILDSHTIFLLTIQNTLLKSPTALRRWWGNFK